MYHRFIIYIVIINYDILYNTVKCNHLMIK